MSVLRRPAGSDEPNYELIWLSVSMVSLGGAIIWFAFGLPWPRCAFHDLTGLPCLTCGMTRSAIQFFHGNFLAALRWNPLIFAGLCFISVFNVYAAIVLLAGPLRIRLAFARQREKRYVRYIAISALGLHWIYLLAHWRAY